LLRVNGQPLDRGRVGCRLDSPAEKFLAEQTPVHRGTDPLIGTTPDRFRISRVTERWKRVVSVIIRKVFPTQQTFRMDMPGAPLTSKETAPGADPSAVNVS